MKSVTPEAATIDVDLLAAQITQLASSKRLGVVPTMPSRVPGPDLMVLLSDHHLSATDFCELAALADAKLLYVEARSFVAARDGDLGIKAGGYGDAAARPSIQAEALHRAAERFNGRIHELELAFVAQGVLHCWAVAAEWYHALVERAAEIALAEKRTDSAS